VCAAPARSVRSSGAVRHVFAAGRAHDDEPVDPGSAHPQGRLMGAKRPVRKVASRAPIRKPVAGTPAWVMPAAVVAGLAVLVAAFLLYRWYITPLPPPAPNP